MGLTQRLGTIPLAIQTDSSNNVGIGGAANASYKLDVNGNGKFTSSNFPIDIYGTTNNYGLRINSVQAPTLLLYSSNANSSNRNWGIFTNSEVYGDFDIRQSNAKDGDMTIGANSTSRFYIRNNGNVGIGTNTATALLTLAKDNVIGINTTDGADNGYLALAGAGGDGDNRGGHIYLSGNERGADAGTAIMAAGSVGSIQFRTGASVERMRIASNGAVTISSDTYPILSVSSTQALSAGNFDIWNFLAPNQTGGAISFNIGKALATYNNAALKFYYVGNNSSSNSLGIGFYDGDNRFNIRADGLLTATGPTSPFNFNPGGRIMYVNSSGQIGSNPSTRESKININPISDVSYIYDLNPVSFYFRKTNMETYEYTDEYYDEIRYGFIADEVEPLNPDLVSYNVNEDGTKKMAGVEYMSIIPVLVKALQEQKKLIDELNAKVTALENK